MLSCNQVVVFSGHETKALLNNSGPRYKRSKLERQMNCDVLWCVLILFAMCLFTAIGKFLLFIDHKTLNSEKSK